MDDPFWNLVATSRRLQAPGGCEWDRAQTVPSLIPYLIEETWEVFDAVQRRRYAELEEELGDVLYTVLFLTLVAERGGWCDLRRMLAATRAKMIRRHPHVFGGKTAVTPQAAYRHWQASKRLEGKKRYSPSKQFRMLLVDWWEWLRKHPEAQLPPATRARGLRRGPSRGPHRPPRRKLR
jgi:uncharacterized protein YabN with tetrapyrrole methylase and pyrophosphatase domain